MRSCILSIGSELLEGSVVDTNSAFIGSSLSHYGTAPDMIRMVKDNKEEIISLFQSLSKEFDVILTTGGLGPTFDDITAECLACACGVDVTLNEKAYKHMKERLERAGVLLNKEHEHQSMLPCGCNLYYNEKGTALGFSMHLNKADIICMPGVPVEMKTMFLNEVLPVLKEKFSLKEITYKDLHFLSIPESYIDTAIRNLQISSDTECIINAGSGKVIVKLRGHNHQEIDGISKVLVSAFKENYLGDNIANISGASAVFMGSVVSYDNSVKQNVLNVPKDILKEYGAVSAECASFMANGVKDLMKTDYSVSVTGIAGPFGATDTKPVGLVYIGTACKNGTSVYKNIFNGDRQQIRMRSAKKAMFHLLNMIKGKQNGNI